jgi:hypothetical protein
VLGDIRISPPDWIKSTETRFGSVCSQTDIILHVCICEHAVDLTFVYAGMLMIARFNQC